MVSCVLRVRCQPEDRSQPAARVRAHSGAKVKENLGDDLVHFPVSPKTGMRIKREHP